MSLNEKSFIAQFAQSFVKAAAERSKKDKIKEIPASSETIVRLVRDKRYTRSSQMKSDDKSGYVNMCKQASFILRKRSEKLYGNGVK